MKKKIEHDDATELRKRFLPWRLRPRRLIALSSRKSFNNPRRECGKAVMKSVATAYGCYRAGGLFWIMGVPVKLRTKQLLNEVLEAVADSAGWSSAGDPQMSRLA